MAMTQKSRKSGLAVLAMLFILLVYSGRSAGQALAGTAVGTRGMVGSAHPLATQAGLEILERGGNAFDAAVAVAAALNVVEPAMSGMGGYGTILVYSARDRAVRFLNCSGRIPAGLNPDIFRPPFPDFEKNRTGAAAVSTPGNVNAWEAMSQRYGKLGRSALFGPAIGLAEKGFVLGGRDAKIIRGAFDEFPDHAQAIYGRNRSALAPGDVLVQKDLGRSLRAIAAKGTAEFFHGPIGSAVVEEVRRRGGALSIDDLAGNQAEWGDPIRIDYHGYAVFTASPPATAFCSLVRLGLMSRFNIASLGSNTADYLHLFAEATKHAFWCRLKYAGDPGVAPPPLDRLLSVEYWSEQAATIDPAKAKPFVYPGLEPGPESHTTHFVIADAEGNIVSATQTLGNAFGSRIMAPGTGIWLNNSLAYCTFEPKGNPMDAHPGRRKLSGDCPTIILKDGRPWAALGTPGGHNIGQTVPQMVMNLIDFKMDIRAALAAPMITFLEPDVIGVERDIPESVRKDLERRGHKIRVTGGFTNAHGLTIEYGPEGQPKRFQGASDPRGGGLAKGY
jgi:gamma-glutamyltranspeptidase / glutathione hydrolase